jgi:hypothetical protein
VAELAIRVLLPFATSYLCTLSQCVVHANVEDDLRAALSNINRDSIYCVQRCRHIHFINKVNV